MKDKPSLFNYIWQPGLAFVFIWSVLILMGTTDGSVVLNALGVAALASSALLVVTNPRSKTCSSGHILGGYAIGIFCGVLCRFFAVVIIIKHFPESGRLFLELFGALSVGLSILLMALCRVLHPPAAGMSEGLTVMPWDFETIMVLCAGIGVLLVLRFVFGSSIKALE